MDNDRRRILLKWAFLSVVVVVFFFSGDNEELQPHEQRFKARLTTYEDYMRKLEVEDVWPIHGTHCTIPKIHKPSKEEFNEKCMKPGLSLTVEP